MSRSAPLGSAWTLFEDKAPDKRLARSLATALMVRESLESPPRLAYQNVDGWRIAHEPWTSGFPGMRGLFLKFDQMQTWYWMEIPK